MSLIISPNTAISTSNTPAGNIAGTNVQEALNELDSEKEPVLGNPVTSGYVLSSTTDGTRSWVNGSSVSKSSLFFMSGW